MFSFYKLMYDYKYKDIETYDFHWISSKETILPV